MYIYILIAKKNKNKNKNKNKKINMFLVRCLLLLRGSSAFGSKNKYCNPTNTEFKLKTGFQSSRRIFRHTLPSRSILG